MHCSRTHHLPQRVEIGVSLVDDSEWGVEVELVRREIDACRIKALVEVELLLLDALVAILHNVGSGIICVEV